MIILYPFWSCSIKIVYVRIKGLLFSVNVNFPRLVPFLLWISFLFSNGIYDLILQIVLINRNQYLPFMFCLFGGFHIRSNLEQAQLNKPASGSSSGQCYVLRFRKENIVLLFHRTKTFFTKLSCRFATNFCLNSYV